LWEVSRMEARWVFKGKGLEAPGLEGNMTQYDQSRKLSQPVSGGRWSYFANTLPPLMVGLGNPFSRFLNTQNDEWPLVIEPCMGRSSGPDRSTVEMIYQMRVIVLPCLLARRHLHCTWKKSSRCVKRSWGYKHWLIDESCSLSLAQASFVLVELSWPFMAAT